MENETADARILADLSKLQLETIEEIERILRTSDTPTFDAQASIDGYHTIANRLRTWGVA